jgi:hypothetical protein
MRILLIGSYKTWRMERGLEAAFRRMGHETLLVDDRRLKRNVGGRLTQRVVLWKARRFDPEFVFLSKCLGLELDTVERVIRGRRNAMWYMDPQWYREIDRPDVGHVLEVARLASTFHVSGFEDEWRGLGTNARFLPAAGDQAIVPVPRDTAYAAQASFIGRGYDADRAEFLMAVKRAGIGLRTWGLAWEQWGEQVGWTGRVVEGEEFSKVCSSSDVVLGIHPTRASGATTYTSNRVWITCLGGGFYLGQRTPGIDALLKGGEHCDYYEDVEDCVARTRRWSEDPVGRERVRAAGEAFVRRYHTFDDRAKYILSGERWASPLV